MKRKGCPSRQGWPPWAGQALSRNAIGSQEVYDRVGLGRRDDQIPFLEVLMVSCDFYSKVSQTGWLKTTGMFSLTVLEARRLK